MRRAIILLISILVITLIFLNLDLEEKIKIYPLKISVGEKFLASVSEVFKPAKRIEVDLSQQKVKIFEGEKIVNEFLVSTGSGSTPTPRGKFKIYNKSVMVYSKLSKCWLPFWVGFTSDGLYGFHEFPICQEGRRGEEKIGEPASLGCVRLKIEDAETFYKWVEIGTPVVIYGTTPTIQEKAKSWCHNFEIDLKPGDWGEEVKNLQIALNSDPETRLAESGPGSPGNETLYFGILTKAAVIKFQEKHKEEILDSLGLPKRNGFVGPLTRNKLNQLYGCQ